MADKQLALITGGGGDIGQAVAWHLSTQYGFEVWLLDLPSQRERMATCCDKIKVAGGVAGWLEADVRATASLEAAFARLTHLNYLINCAGIVRRSALREMDDSDLDAVLDINLKGSFKTCRAAARIMATQNSGRIINLASGLAAHPGALYSAYGASKAGVIALTKALALELAPFGVLVNCVAPGMVQTRFVDSWTAIELENYAARIPLGRVATAEDVAETVAYLCSPASRYLTGQVIWLNGGGYMP